MVSEMASLLGKKISRVQYLPTGQVISFKNGRKLFFKNPKKRFYKNWSPFEKKVANTLNSYHSEKKERKRAYSRKYGKRRRSRRSVFDFNPFGL